MNIDIDEDILKWVIDPIGVLGIINNPRNALLTKSDRGYELFNEKKGTNRKLRGLTTALAECFWEQTLDKQYAKKFPNSPELRKHIALKRKRERQKPKKNKNALTAKRGFSRGLAIHREAEDLITMDAITFHKRHPHGIHPWSMALVEAIAEKYQWKPVASEFIVADEDLGIATEIDQIWVNKKGVLQLIEVKSGYETREEWKGAKGGMQKSLAGIFENSACDRAIIQCMVSTMMALDGHGLKECRYASWVAHVNDNGVELVPIRAALIEDMGPFVHCDLMDHQEARKEAKKAAKAATTKTVTVKKRPVKKFVKTNRNHNVFPIVHN